MLFKKVFLFVEAVVLLGGVLLWLILSEKPAGVEEKERVCFKESCFQVEIADTPEERSQGLMFREHLAENKGMLFIFEKEGFYSFWMKNTLIPLDMIWLDEQGRIVFIKEAAQPCPADVSCPRIVPETKAKYVLELNSGLAKTLNLSLGQPASIDI